MKFMIEKMKFPCLSALLACAVFGLVACGGGGGGDDRENTNPHPELVGKEMRFENDAVLSYFYFPDAATAFVGWKDGRSYEGAYVYSRENGSLRLTECRFTSGSSGTVSYDGTLGSYNSETKTGIFTFTEKFKASATAEEATRSASAQFTVASEHVAD